MMKSVNISGVVLAGGENSRYGGRIKSNELIGGEKIIDRIVVTISGIFNEIIVVTNTPEEFKRHTNCKIVCDIFKKVGPLGGIHAAMKSSTCEALFVFAGDMPFLEKEIILNQITYYNTGSSEAVLPAIDNRIEPLHGIYRTCLLERVEAYLGSKTDYAIRDFLKSINVDHYRLNNSPDIVRVFTNINTPEEAQKAIKDSDNRFER